MTENFTQLLNQSLEKINTKPGSLIQGKVLSIEKDIVLIDAGLKSESSIPIEQFKDSNGKLEVKIGEKVDVILDAVEDGFGETILSREKAKRQESWSYLEKAHKTMKTVLGTINGKVKGGFTVEVNGIRAFLPGSLVDIRPLKDTLHLEGKNIEFKVIKLDQKRNNVVVSRRAVIINENDNERNNLLKTLKEDEIVKGIVKNLTDYGAFIDLGGIDGLLHITDIAWKRVKHPREILKIGDEINVKILKFDREKIRVSLGLKQLTKDPWISITKKYPEGTKIKGRVTNLTDYGFFVEIQDGIEGLVHVSEIDWTNKNINSNKITNIEDIVEVMILNIDEERRRISLGLKQCTPNPWKKFSETHNKGEIVEGTIKSITDFGIFIGLKGGIDGLIHVSDISWNKAGIQEIQKYKKGDKIKASILQIDSERERISLGIKHLTEDPFINYLSIHKKNEIINGRVIQINQNEILIELKEEIHGKINRKETSFIEDKKQEKEKIKIGDIIKTKIIGSDKKNRIIILSLEKKNKNNKNVKNKKKEKIKNKVMVEAFKAAKNE